MMAFCGFFFLVWQAKMDGAAPDSYVKLYIIPDPSKTSKKKTRVIKNTQHPTFNESVS